MSKTQATCAYSATRVLREGPGLDPDRISDALAGIEAGFSEDVSATRIAVALGEGVKVYVRNGELRIADGLGSCRRERSWPRVGSGLRRVIVGADSGFLTLHAVTWCQSLKIPIVIVDRDGEVVLGPGAHGHDDPRLRRTQATASEEVAVDVAAGLIVPKVLGQASVADTRLGRQDVGELLRDIVGEIEGATSVDEIRGLEATAAGCYFDAWVDHPSVVPRFTVADVRRVPSHWCCYDGRRSLIGGGNSNRKAERPTNCLLNLLYALAAVEVRLACLAVGLDPAFGVLHLDAVNRDSMVLDLLEPLRPLIDRFIVDLLAEATFSRRDFIERGDGSIRVAPSLVQQLAGTMPTWARAVSPHAEQVAHAFGQLVAGRWSPRTPLTKRNARSAAAVVKARKLHISPKSYKSMGG